MRIGGWDLKQKEQRKVTWNPHYNGKELRKQRTR